MHCVVSFPLYAENMLNYIHHKRTLFTAAKLWLQASPRRGKHRIFRSVWTKNPRQNQFIPGFPTVFYIGGRPPQRNKSLPLLMLKKKLFETEAQPSGRSRDVISLSKCHIMPWQVVARLHNFMWECISIWHLKRKSGYASVKNGKNWKQWAFILYKYILLHSC